METENNKECETCKSRGPFYRNAALWDGLDNLCQACRKKAVKKKDPEINKRDVARYKESHPGEMSSIQRKYEDAHREERNKVRAELRRARHADPEYREMLAARRRERYANDPKYRFKVIEAVKESISKDPEKKRDAGSAKTRKVR